MLYLIFKRLGREGRGFSFLMSDISPKDAGIPMRVKYLQFIWQSVRSVCLIPDTFLIPQYIPNTSDMLRSC